MNKPNETKVDLSVAYSKSAFTPATLGATEEMAYDIVDDLIEQARRSGRRPVMVEVTIRVAP